MLKDTTSMTFAAFPTFGEKELARKVTTGRIAITIMNLCQD
jgi:hypothetical protein